MNTTQTTHPSHENLAAFNSGRLGVLESAEVERHLTDCEACCRLLTTIPNDTLISLLGPQSETKAEATSSVPTEQQVMPRPALDVTIAPGNFKTQADAKLSAPLSTEVPAELQGHPRYRIQALLGRGGMGSVYQAEHRLMNRLVALKVIDRQLVQTPGLVERFHREVQAAAKLSHPNIVTAYDAEQAGDLHYLVMELVEGQDLAEVVRQRGKLPVQEACEYVRQAAMGLQHASERGMVHRDIKPQNLMLQASLVASAPGVIKILDFGLAQFATEIAETSGLTQIGAMMGTPDYMAPEQARDAHSADIRADIYSLGCTLYFLLSGGAPFPQGSIVEKIMAHVERKPTPLTELRNDVPPELAAVLAKMMAKAPRDRIQTPAEVAEALLPFASSGIAKIAAEGNSPVAKAAARQPRSPLIIAAAVFAVLAILMLLGVIVIVTDQGRIEVQSEVDDVDLIVKRGGEQVDILDTKTGSKVRWFPSGKYELELKGNRNDIVIHNDGFQLTRWGKQIVTLSRVKTPELAVQRPSEEPLRELRRFEGHTGPVRRITFSDDGKWAISGSGYPWGDSTLRLWNVETGKQERRYFDAGMSWVMDVEMSADKTRAVSASWDGIIRVWDLETGKILHRLTGHEELAHSVAISPDGLQALSGGGGKDTSVRIWDLKTGQQIGQFNGHKGNVARVAFAGDGQALSSGWAGDESVCLWNINTREEIRRFKGHVGGVNSFAVSSDGNRLLSVGHDCVARLWNIDGTSLHELKGHSEPVNCAAFLPGNRYALTGSADKTIRLWDLESGKEIGRLPAQPGVVWSIAISPDGTRALTGSESVWKGESWESQQDLALRLWSISDSLVKTQWKGGPKDAPPPAIAPFNAEQARQHQDAWAQHLGVPIEFTNSIGMKFRLLPPGEFMIGSTPEEIAEALKIVGDADDLNSQFARDCAKSEGPRHKVILTQPRYLGVHEVTQSQYEKIMRKNPSHFATTGQGKEAVVGLDTANHPVESVSWHEAVAFCAKLSQQENLSVDNRQLSDAKTPLGGYGYRLPTEAEWEFACRAGTTTKFLGGDGDEQLDQTSWIGRNSGLRTHAVGELLANPFGLQDLQGNVWEWCQDLWELTYYNQFLEKPALDPIGPLPRSDEQGHVLRGGGWFGQPYQCRASFHHHIGSQYRDSSGGFRVSLSVEAVKMAIKKPTVKNPVVPIGKNLITDPSLEEVAVGEKYPMGWGSGNLIPPGAYQFSVAEGGKTGKRGWRIEGDGQYAVVPTNRPGVDRALRYGARGWVRLEAGSAQLKILYFDGNGRYIGENRSAITNKRDGWQQLTMLDDLAKWPEARHLSLALTLIGKGKAVFDDLEFTAFDATKLPANFEKDYASTPKHDPALFDRWAGRWESVTEHKATAATPAKTMKGETIVRKVLDDQFLLWQWKDESGSSQYLSLLGFDENAGSYHIWVFGSAGEVFERTGQWDAASQTLALDLKAPTPGVSGLSTDRFIDKDRIESLILVKDAGGQITRDLRATWTRKAVPIPADIELSGGSAAGSKELALVQKMAGDWTIRSTSKPSVWEPKEKSETFTEQVAWTNGGRFLIFRTYDEAKRMTSLSLMTYEPNESSYHFWTFAKGVYGGQWRITWDASSRAFHWRSIDMPVGWIGTGYNRWIDDNTFDNQALIKDEAGRVLLDSTQEKRRIK